MPVQCALSWIEFQEEKNDPEHLSSLRQLCRPKRCPYCGEYYSLWGHGFVLRYIILAALKTILLHIPRYKCKYCSHTMRVLPIELHNYCNHVSQTIRDLINYKLVMGKYQGKIRIPKNLQRHWYNLYMKRLQEYVNLGVGAEACTLLKQLPPFAVLFRNMYETCCISTLKFNRIAIHRILPLIVCLDTS